MDLAKDAYAELRTFFRHFDPQHEREEEIFTKLGYIDIQFLADRIKGDVLLGVGYGYHLSAIYPVCGFQQDQIT